MAQPSQPESETLRQCVEDVTARWEEAFNRGDAGACAALYTDDATVLPPDSVVVHGKQAIEALFKDWLEEGVANASLGTEQVGSSGDLAYQVGMHAADELLEDGTIERGVGQIVNLLKRQADGSWKLHVSIYNTAPIA